MEKSTEENLNTLRKKYEREFFPIIRTQTQAYLQEVVKMPNVKSILELGTGLGYSGSVMLATKNDTTLTTVEKEKVFFEKAKANFAKLNLDKRVSVINEHAEVWTEKIFEQNINADIKNQQKYDLIFLDCAKSRYIEMIDKLVLMLNSGGILFADNVLYMGMVNSDQPPKHKHRTIVNNLKKFIEYCRTSDSLKDVEVHDVEDGFLIAVKR